MIWKKKPFINVPTTYYISFTEYTQMRDVDPKAAGYFYTVVLNRLILILDKVFSSKKIFANISYELNEEYEKLTGLLRLIKSRKDLSLPDTELRVFASLHTDLKEKAGEWSEIKDLFVDDVQILSKMYGSPNEPYRYPLPFDIEKCFRDIDDMLQSFTDEQNEYEKKLHPHTWDKTTGTLSYKDKSLVFTPGSKIHSIYSLLEDHFGKLSSLDDLNKLSDSINQTTKNISDIRKRLTESGLSSYLLISSTGDGGYTLKLR